MSPAGGRGRWVVFKLMWNEGTWACLGLFALLGVIVLSAQGVRPEGKAVFLVELALPLLAAPLAVPMGLLDREYGMVEILNAARTPSALRTGRRLAQALVIPVLLAVPLAAGAEAAARVSLAAMSPLTLGLSGAALVVFAAGLAFVLATVTGSVAAGYAAPPALVVAVMSLKGFLPPALQPFPMASTLGRSLAVVALEPIAATGVFWLNRLGYAAAGLALMGLGLAYLQGSRWGY